MSDLKVTYAQLLSASAATAELETEIGMALTQLASDLGMSVGLCNGSSALHNAFPGNSEGQTARSRFTSAADLMLQVASTLQSSAGVWSGALTELVGVFETLDADLAKEG